MTMPRGVGDNWIHKDSGFVSQYYPWFCEMGYPELDIAEHKDGSWSIVEMMEPPYFSDHCPHRVILGAMEGVEKSFSFCKKYTEMIDLTKQAIWDREAAKTSKVMAERARAERHWEENAMLKYEAISQNQDLMERIHKFGLTHMGLDQIFRHIDPWHKRRMGYANRQLFATR